ETGGGAEIVPAGAPGVDGGGDDGEQAASRPAVAKSRPQPADVIPRTPVMRDIGSPRPGQ
ncbi:MAG: hypothetical protein WBA65_11375, partial [Rhodanobacter sp.]